MRLIAKTCRSNRFHLFFAHYIGVVRGAVVPELQRAINVQGRALLKRFNLPDPLVEQMVASKTGSCLVNI